MVVPLRTMFADVAVAGLASLLESELRRRPRPAHCAIRSRRFSIAVSGLACVIWTGIGAVLPIAFAMLPVGTGAELVPAVRLRSHRRVLVGRARVRAGV